MALIYDVVFDSQTRILSLLDKAGNAISSCEVPSKSKELTLTATADNSSVKLKKNGTLSNTYEVNTGSGWTAYAFDTVIPLNAGESCKWRCSAHPTTQSLLNYVQFVMTGQIEASGNCNSMLNSDFEGITSLSGYDYAFCGLFQRCTSLTHAPELPSTTLSSSCYLTMFSGCTSLRQAPNLPANTLAEQCYKSMFYGCTFLINAPNLPATTLAEQCYYSMFQGCTSLTQAPSLPATTLATSCYYKMFYECTNLVQAPDLPALSIPDSFLSGSSGDVKVFGCYVSMFEGCRSLVQAPALPATTLGKGCYVRMFYGCTSLVQAPELPATTLPDVLNAGGTSVPAFGCYSDMFGGCTSLVQAPSLPATTLGGACYGWMFYGCTSLVKAPELPATTLTFECYAGMFQGCRSLVKAPELPATTLPLSCYYGMFYGCTSLNKIRVSATDISADRCTVNWTQGVSATGDFYCNPNTTWPTGISGIPWGWTRHDIADYPDD